MLALEWLPLLTIVNHDSQPDNCHLYLPTQWLMRLVHGLIGQLKWCAHPLPPRHGRSTASAGVAAAPGTHRGGGSAAAATLVPGARPSQALHGHRQPGTAKEEVPGGPKASGPTGLCHRGREAAGKLRSCMRSCAWKILEALELHFGMHKICK